MKTNLLDYLEQGALRHHPDKVAIVDGDARCTFAELAARARGLAARLVALDASCSEPIAVYLPKSMAVVVADLGIVYSGNAYMNLDVRLPAKRLGNILAHVGPALVVTSAALSGAVLAAGVLADRIVLLDPVGHPVAAEAADERIDAALLRDRLETRIDTDPVCLINTSGSTGTPKAVALSHRGTIDFMDWVFDTFDFDGSEVVGNLSPLFFDIYTLELVLCLAKGATLVLIPDQLATFPPRLMTFLAERSVSFLFWVPSIMVTIAKLGLLEAVPLPALRTVFFAGEVFPTRHLNHWRRALPEARFVNLYGPIEIHVDCTYFVVDREFADDEPLPIGRPCRNTDILILDGEDRPCESGQHGELCVRGSSLALGYWNDLEKTAKAFVQNPLNRRYPEPIYRTGDLAYRDASGEIHLVGRKDFQVKHLGYRIELPEIEHHVLGVPGIANACVLYNAERKEITLFYEVEGDAVAPATIRGKLTESLPSYMLPTAFHPMEELPRNPNGKIDRNGLLLSLREPS
jgi:D-alanine--poly(phosphoribitol) ligase subunit 1